MGIKRVSAKEAVHLAEVGYAVIDVRTVGEYQQGHPKGSLRCKHDAVMLCPDNRGPGFDV